MGKFRIAAPFIKISEIGSLKKAGADELYCGVIDRESEKLWPASFVTINRRGKKKNFESFDSFKSAVSEAHKFGLPVYVTLNSFYTSEQYPWLLKAVSKIQRLAGVKGIIVSDIAFLLTLRKMGFDKEICVSTLGTSFNSKTADFYASLGAARVILDRQLGPSEIRDLIEKKSSAIGIEIFALDTACLFIDGYCMFCHFNDRAYDDSPQIIKRGNRLSFVSRSFNTSISPCGCMDVQAALEKIDDNDYPALRSRIKCCNLCLLSDLKDCGDITLKITERGIDQTEPVRMLKSLIDNVCTGALPVNMFHKEAMKTYYAITKNRCSRSSCPSRYYK